MKLLFSIDNQTVHQNLVSLAAEERRVTLEVLQHLRECERRRIFAERGHSSLFDYVVRELHYSESAAQRRISAMRALKDLPDLEAKVQSGELKVTQLARVQTFLRSEKKEGKVYSQEEKRDLILDTIGKSSRETDQLLAERSPAFVTQEKMRVLTPKLTQITLTADEALMANLRKIRDVFAHQLPVVPSMAELISWMSKRLLESHEKRTGDRSVGVDVKTGKTEEGSREEDLRKEGPKKDALRKEGERRRRLPAQTLADDRGQNALPAPQVRSRYIPAEVRRKVWTRDCGQCAFVSGVTGKRCDSRHRIQIDHVIPYARGGSSTDAESLRLLCFTHNQSESRRLLGVGT